MIGERRSELKLGVTTREALFGKRLIADWTDHNTANGWLFIRNIYGYQYDSEENASNYGTPNHWADSIEVFDTWEEAEEWLMEAQS